MEASRLAALPGYLALARAGKRIIIASFVVSILYNIIGLSFALQAMLSPLVAAVLMPASSITIVIFTWLASVVAGKRILGRR
jgi:P-type Cu+ transporter